MKSILLKIIVPKKLIQIFVLIQKFVHNLKHLIWRSYILFWHTLSMDPRVRISPYDPAPENEVFLTLAEKSYIRFRRLYILIGNILLIWAIYLHVTLQVKLYTVIWGIFLHYISGFAEVIGVHRYFSHRTFKAKPFLKYLFVILHSTTLQYSVYDWCKIHRVHHKYSDTDADPHNPTRGFFFCHIGWFLTLPRPEVKEKLATVWLEDLKQDKLIMFHHKYFYLFAFVAAYFIPTYVPWYFWNESLLTSHLVIFVQRLIQIQHFIYTLNSIAHAQGSKPYNKRITACNVPHILYAFLSIGESGSHNFHHTFPGDYRCSEMSNYFFYTCTRMIELLVSSGLAYDLKTVSNEEIRKYALRTGDGTHSLYELKGEGK